MIDADVYTDHNNYAASTPINIELMEKYLQGHPDKHFVDFLITGLRHGFHPMIDPVPTAALTCTNNRSALSQPGVVSSLIQTEVKGFVLGPFTASELTYSVYRINPLTVAEGKYSKKKRLILDLSAPAQYRNSEHK